MLQHFKSTPIFFYVFFVRSTEKGETNVSYDQQPACFLPHTGLWWNLVWVSILKVGWQI